MTDSPNPEGPWTIWVCDECGYYREKRITHLHSLSEPPYSRTVPLREVEVIPADAAESQLAEAEAELKRLRGTE